MRVHGSVWLKGSTNQIACKSSQIIRLSLVLFNSLAASSTVLTQPDPYLCAVVVTVCPIYRTSTVYIVLTRFSSL